MSVRVLSKKYKTVKMAAALFVLFAFDGSRAVAASGTFACTQSGGGSIWCCYDCIFKRCARFDSSGDKVESVALSNLAGECGWLS